MRKFCRVLYPIAIYMGISMVISIGVMLSTVIMSTARAVGDVEAAMEEAQALYFQNILLVTMVCAVITLPIHLWFFKRDRIMRADVKNPWLCKNNWGYLIFLGISACIAGNNLIVLTGIDRLFKGHEIVVDGIYQSPVWLQLLAVGIIIPVVEELTFRALGFRRLRDSMSFYWSAVISAICFAVFHGNVVQGVYAFVLGYLMAWIYERYDSFGAPVLVHCSANIVSVLLTISRIGNIIYRNTMTLWISTILMILLAAGCIRAISQRVVRRQVIDETIFKEENL